jgi:hypothetical protein
VHFVAVGKARLRLQFPVTVSRHDTVLLWPDEGYSDTMGRRVKICYSYTALMMLLM